MKKNIDRLTGCIWMMLTAFIAIALLINAVSALMSKAQFAWWHLFTLAICWNLSKEFSNGQSDVIFRSYLTKIRASLVRPFSLLKGAMSFVIRKILKVYHAMRVELSNARTHRLAKKAFPWAEKIVKVKGGWLCFESYNDFLIWNTRDQSKEAK